ncbi:MAG: DUF1643 domain-containing protein [bacterium]|nr:DUF1643 domain-containing protein [bacterium]
MKKTCVMVDGHVHIYDCYDLENFFNYAISNIELSFRSQFAAGEYKNVLLFTEGNKTDFFSKFKQDTSFLNDFGYGLRETKESCSLVLTKHDVPVCYLLKGRQVVTAENLEVLLIASDLMLEDGLPIDEVLKKIIDNKNIAVLAWGFGKWLFNRGKIVADKISKYQCSHLFIGDNSGRPVFWGTPPQFKTAATLKLPLLNGSDPLPFSGEESKVGSYGFSVNGDFDPEKPAKSLQEIILSKKTEIKPFGKRDSTLSFFKRQAKMYLKKYLKINS